MAITLGVAIHRRGLRLVGVQRGKNLFSIVLERRAERAAGMPLADALRNLLAEFVVPGRPTSLALALSPSDLACGDAWTPPNLPKGKKAARLGAALVEVRCASETLENLVVDVDSSGRSLQAIALDRGMADDLVKATAGFKIELITSIPSALAHLYGSAALTQGGERIEVASKEGRPSWRMYPVDGPDEAGSLSWNGREIPFEQAAALAAACGDPERVPNLLNSLEKYRKTFLKRFRDPILNIAVAAVLCLGALGVRFHREAVREGEQMASIRRAELELWRQFLPADEPREGRLLQAMRDRLGDLGETSGAAEFPSALAFWGEIGKQMPDPESLGLTLESLDLAPDGGRISARVPVVKDDPLKNAAQLEGKLNLSKKMTARGDYEVRDGQVQVRLRMDYKP